ncbi:MAG: RNase adapter RapZ [Clostridiales Family XIII bacterium]|jgi:UPF0042 nucleotide-binding protein|nr:RNase adapter RapZ [Clostridiales Family XIII bacterium]
MTMELIIITGVSGAGKSLASDCFEDIGYYCIDNLPPSLIKDFTELISQRAVKVEKAAFVVDIRGGETFDDIKDNLKELEHRGVSYKILFIDASDEVILRRFSETRRAHPLAVGITNEEALYEERKLLEPIRKIADFALDTSGMNNAALVQTIRSYATEGAKQQRFRFIVESFGYKYGIPPDADFVFDVRFIPNPFYIESLKKLTGRSKKVRDYVMRTEGAKTFLEEVLTMMTSLKPAFIREGKSTVNISFGCTGGQHRSVTMANIVEARLKEQGEEVTLKHRDL